MASITVQTMECLLANLHPKLRQEMELQMSSHEEILACYETTRVKRQLFLTMSDYFGYVVTQSRLMRARFVPGFDSPAFESI